MVAFRPSWRLVVIGFSLVLSTVASSLAAAEYNAIDDPLPERIVRFSNGTIVSADIPYSAISGYRLLTLDLYRPSDTRAKPLIVYIHGGGWTDGHKRQSGPFDNYPEVLAGFAARGFVVASVEYRLAREAPFPAALDDVQAAIRFLRSNAAKFGIDPQRVALWGSSAGAQLAALAAVDCGKSFHGDDQSGGVQSDCVRAVVGWYGVYDFRTLPRPKDPDSKLLYLDCPLASCSEERLAAASPAAQVAAENPPFLLIHGDDDRVVPVAQSVLFAQKLRSVNVSVELDVIHGVGHGLESDDPSKKREAVRNSLELTYRFLDEKLK